MHSHGRLEGRVRLIGSLLGRTTGQEGGVHLIIEQRGVFKSVPWRDAGLCNGSQEAFSVAGEQQMSDDREVQESQDRPKEAPKKSDVLSPDETKDVQAKAADLAGDRKRFLESSLGKGLSASTEYLMDKVLAIFDGAKQIVGLAHSDTANEPKAAENQPRPSDSGIAGMVTSDLSILHPIDSVKEIYHKIAGDAPTEAPKPPSDTAPEKAPEAPKPEEKPEEALKKIKEDPQTKEAHDHLEKLAGDKIKNPAELKKFKEDMEALEKRASEQKPPLSPEQIRDTYKEISKLMETPDGKDVPIKAGDRVKLAEQVMRQAAHPTDISQGEYNTCNVTTVETRTYTRSPADAARLVADVATTGKYKSNGDPPVAVAVDAESLKRHGQSTNDTPADGKRTYASQIFEVTAVNLHYKKAHVAGGEDIRYEQHDPKGPGPNNRPPADSGERLLNYSKPDPKTEKATEVPEKDGTPARHPKLSDSDIAEISREVTRERPDGRNEGPVVIEREGADTKTADKITDLKNEILAVELKKAGIVVGPPLDFNDPKAVQEFVNGPARPVDLNDPAAVQKTRDAIDEREKHGLPHEKAEELRRGLDTLEKAKHHELRNDNGVVVIHSEKDLADTLAKMKAEGRLPAVIAVSASKEPFRSEGGAHQTGDIGGGHVVTVTDYHPAKDGQPAKVDVDNQWGKSADHTGDKALTVKELFEAQEKPKGPVVEKLEELEKKFAAGEFKGKEAEYDKQLKELYLEELKRWDKAKGTADEAQELVAIETLKDSARQLPPPRGKQVLEAAVAEFKKQKTA